MKNLTKFEKLVVLSHFLSDYHSGQFSKGYRYLCLSLRSLRNMGIDYPLDIPLKPKHRKLYFHLVEKYQNEV